MSPKIMFTTGKGKGKAKADEQPKKKLRLDDIPFPPPNAPLIIGGERESGPVREARSRPVFGALVDEPEGDVDAGSGEEDDVPLVDMRRAKSTKGVTPERPRVVEIRAEARKTPGGVVPYKERFINDAAELAFRTRFRGREILERGVDMEAIEKGFRENLVKRKWTEFVKVPSFESRKPNYTLAREFMANLTEVDLETGVVRVRGVDVPFTPKAISDFYKAPVVAKDFVDTIKAKIEKGEDPFEELRLAIDPSIPWTMKNAGVTKVPELLKTTNFSRDWKVKARFVQNRLLPKDNFHKFIMLDLSMLYALHFGLPIDVGRVLYSELTRTRKDQRHKLMCIHLLNGLCLAAGVKEYDDDERYTKKQVLLSPLLELGSGVPPIRGDVGQSGQTAAPPPVTEPVTDTVPPPVTEPVVEPTSEFIRTIPISTRNRYLLMDGVRQMLDRVREQNNTIIRGMQELRTLVPTMPELPLDSEPFVFPPHLEEAIDFCLEEDAAEMASRSLATASASAAGPSQTTPAPVQTSEAPPTPTPLPQATPAPTTEAPPSVSEAPPVTTPEATSTVPPAVSETPAAEDQTSV